MAFYKKQENGYKEFSEDLGRSDFPSSVLLYGEERFLMDWAVDGIKKRFLSEATMVMDYQVVDEDDAGELLGAIAILPVMSERRVVVVRNSSFVDSARPAGLSDSDIETIKNTISGSSGSLVVVFVSDTIDGRNKLVKALKSSGKSYEMGSLDRNGLTAFAAKRLHSAGFKIGRAEMDALIRSTGYDNKESDYRLYSFQNDLNKLMSLTEGTYITEEDIRKAVSGDRDTFIFDLLDGISGNDKKKAFMILGNRLERDQYEAMSLTGAIVSQIEIMVIVKEYYDREGLSPAAIHSKTGLNEFRIKKALSYARRYDTARLRSMLKSIYEVSENIVTGLMEPRLALEMFVAGI